MLDPKELSVKIEDLKARVDAVVKDIDAALRSFIEVRDQFAKWQETLELVVVPAAVEPQPMNGAKRLETLSDDPEPKTLKERVLHHLKGHPDSIIEDIAVALDAKGSKNAISQAVYQLRQQKLVKMKGERGSYSYSAR